MKRLVEILLARPRGLALALVAVTGLAIVQIVTGFVIESDIADAVKGRSETYMAYLAFEERFEAPSKDEVFMVQAPDLGADNTLAALEDLVLELSLTDGVLGVISVFSLPDPDGLAHSYLSRPDLAGLSDADRLDRARAGSPLVRQIVSADRTTTLISVIPDLSLPQDRRDAALAAALRTADPRLDISPIGLSAVQRAISGGLVHDLTFLLPMTIVSCLVVSLVVFRSLRGAVIVTLPAIIALIWTFATMAAFSIPFTTVVAISPAVIVVLAIADSIHMLNAIAGRRAAGAARTEAIAGGMAETFPAVVMATLTTVLAFASLRIVGSQTLSDLALVGSFGLGLTLLAVVLTVPVASRLLLPKTAAGRRMMSFSWVSRAAIAALSRRRRISLAAVVLLAALLVAQTRTVPGFIVTNHVPFGSEIRHDLEELGRKLPGSDQLFAVIDADTVAGIGAEDLARLHAASQALYGTPRVFPDDLATLPPDSAIVRRFLAPDDSAFALPVPYPLTDDWRQILARAADIRARLAAEGLGDTSTVTGHMVMASTEIPQVVWEMRAAFYVAVGLVTILAALLLRSVPLALISLVPNLIPILGIEAFLILLGQPLTVTSAIALTVAFGIALDDTIHLLNRLRLARPSLRHLSRAEIAEALRVTVPPVVTTSLILFVGLGMTVFSALPSAALFGQLVAGALALALLADLFLFPGLLAWWNETRGKS